MSKERPILFSGAMVRAILAGAKTQTRRVVKPQPLWVGDPSVPFKTQDADPKGIIPCPYGQPGDRLWVRETWYCDLSELQSGPYLETPDALENTVYRADGEYPFEQNEVEGSFWKPSIHMPRWASRILLEIESIRVERLKDISEADAKAEGATVWPECKEPAAICLYREIWEKINGKDSWEANPWVWVVTFKVITPSEEGRGV